MELSWAELSWVELMSGCCGSALSLVLRLRSGHVAATSTRHRTGATGATGANGFRGSLQNVKREDGGKYLQGRRFFLWPMSECANPMSEIEIRRFETLGSTNDYARQWAREGAPHLAFVVAREQSGGRGRRGRSWSSPLGGGFYGSMIVRCGAAAQAAGEDAALLLARWTIGAAVGVARALEALELSPELKWPNDALLNGRKVGGILCEAEWYQGRPAFLIVGVGLNVSHRRQDLPARPVFPASSLLLESGRLFEPGRVEQALVTALRGVAGEPEGGWDGLREAWEGRCAGRGELISVSEEAGKYFGVLRGLDPSGALLVATAGGLRRVVSGDVNFEYTQSLSIKGN